MGPPERVLKYDFLLIVYPVAGCNAAAAKKTVPGLYSHCFPINMGSI